MSNPSPDWKCGSTKHCQKSLQQRKAAIGRASTDFKDTLLKSVSSAVVLSHIVYRGADAGSKESAGNRQKWQKSTHLDGTTGTARKRFLFGNLSAMKRCPLWAVRLPWPNLRSISEQQECLPPQLFSEAAGLKIQLENVQNLHHEHKRSRTGPWSFRSELWVCWWFDSLYFGMFGKISDSVASGAANLWRLNNKITWPFTNCQVRHENFEILWEPHILTCLMRCCKK